MPKISALNSIEQLTTSSILPVVDGNETQKVTLQRVVEFVSASIDVTFATEIELLQSASSITSSLNAFASASVLSVASKLSTSSFEAYTSSVSFDTSSLLLSSSFNTFTSSYKTDSASFDSRIDNLELISVTPFLSSSTFNTFTSSNDSTNSTQNSRLSSLESNSGSYLLKLETGSFITEAETGSFLTSIPNGIISSSAQITEFGFISQSTDITPFLSSSTFNTFTSSYETDSSSFDSRINAATNEQDLSGLLTTSSFNSYTSSNDIIVNSLISVTSSYVTSAETSSFITESETGSFVTDVSMFLSKSIFDSYTSSLDGTISSSEQITNFGFATTSSVLNVDTSSLVTTSSFNDFTSSYITDSSSFDIRILNAGGGATDVSMFLSQSVFNTLSSSLYTYTSSINSYTESINSTTESLNSKTGSYATTGSNSFDGSQTITGSLTVTALTTISSSISANSSSIYLSSGSNLIIQDNAYVEVSGSQLISGSLIITGSLSISDSGSLGAKLWQLLDVNDNLSGSINDGYMLSYNTDSNSWVATAGATARGSIRLYMATSRSNGNPFYFNANTRTASDSASPSSDTAFMVTTTLLNKVTVFLRQDAAGPNSTQIAIYKNANGSAFSSASQIATATLSLTQDTIQTYTFTGLTLNQFDSLHVYCDPTSTPGILYAIVTVE